MGKLTANEVKSYLNKPGTYQDGDGLFLKVDKRGGASWLARIQRNGNRRDYSIGSAKLVSLAKARAEAAKLREAVRIEGRDPVAEKRKAKAAAVTFKQAALAFLENNKSQWASPKHEGQWLATMETYAFPKLGGIPVDKVDSPDIIAAISEVWMAKAETGRRVRQRICTTLDYAKAQGWRTAEAPVRSLQAGKGLPRQPGSGNHRLAMPHEDIPAFITYLRSRHSYGRLALELAILTATRSQEVRLATWDEFDLEAARWTIPAARNDSGTGGMKKGSMPNAKAHIVPLSTAALSVLKRADALRMAGTNLVFPGAKQDKAISDMTLLKVLRDADQPYHVHGFRSAFRDWVGEATTFQGEVAEAALAHKVPDAVEAAYLRTTYLTAPGGKPGKRVALMEAWGGYCDGGTSGAKVVPIKKAHTA